MPMRARCRTRSSCRASPRVAGHRGVAGRRAGHKVALSLPKRGHRVDLLAMANDNARHSFGEKQRQVRRRRRSAARSAGAPAAAVAPAPHRVLRHLASRRGRHRGRHRRDDRRGARQEALPHVQRTRRRRRIGRGVGGERRLRGDVRGARATLSDGPEGGGEAEGDAGSPGGEPPTRAGTRRISSSSTAAEGSSPWRWRRRTTSVCTICQSSRSPRSARTVAGETLVDRVYLPGPEEPNPARSSTTSLFLLARLRDEAHRFSNRARMRIGKKRRFHSPLDDVKGLGPKAKKALLKHVGNLAAIRAADDATLLAVPGVTARHLRALRAA
jgi:excinuclease ABC subunit C